MTAARNTRSNNASKTAALAAAAAALAASTVDTAKEKAKVAIFTRPNAKVQAVLFLSRTDTPRAPMFGGTIGTERVSAFLRHPEGKTPFLSFVNGDNVQIATANVRIREADGAPTLKVILGKEGEAKTEAWFSLSKNVSDEQLALMGAKMDKLHVKAEKETAAA